LLRLMLASLRFHWRTNLAVACGDRPWAGRVDAAPCGRRLDARSLRHLTLDRLGRIDEALVTEHIFRAALADELGAAAGDSASR